MSKRSHFDTWQYRLKLFMRTVTYNPFKVVEEQPTWKIRLLRIRAFFSAKLPAILDVLLGFVAFAIIPTILFAVIYHLLNVPGDPLELFWGSFQMFTVIGPTKYENVIVNAVMTTPDKICVREQWQLVYVITCIESIMGKVTDAVFLGAMTGAMLRPINRLWVPGRFTYNGKRIRDLDYVREVADRIVSTKGKNATDRDKETINRFAQLIAQDRLEFSYWLRLTEKEWLHHVTTTLRVQSDEDDRQIKPDAAAPLPMFEHKTYRIMRRGTNFIDVGLNAEDENGAPEWQLLEILTKVMIACFGREYLISQGMDSDKRDKYRWPVWNARNRCLEGFDPQSSDGRRYRHYQIQFRVAGTSDEGHEMNIERKYSIYDVLYPYTFAEIEIPEHGVVDLVHSRAMDGEYLAVQPAYHGENYQVEVRMVIKHGRVKHVSCCKLFQKDDGRESREPFGKGELSEEDLVTYANHVLENPSVDANNDKIRTDAGAILSPVFEAIDYCCDSAWAKPYHRCDYRYTNVWMVDKTEETAVEAKLAETLRQSAACCEGRSVDLKSVVRGYAMAFQLLDRLLVINKVLGACSYLDENSQEKARSSMDYVVRPVTPKDGKLIYDLMVRVQQAVIHSRDGGEWTDDERADVHDFFIISDRDRVKRKVNNADGFGYVVEGLNDDGTTEPVAYSLFEKLPKKPTDNISRVAGLSGKELGHVAEADSVGVLPGWRGLGLQRKLERLGEAEARRRGCRHMVATVHPRNEHSLRNFIASGYTVEAHITDNVPESRVLHDAPVPGERLTPVERYVVRKDL